MAWDPNPCAFVEAFLHLKASEMQAADNSAWDIRAVVVPLDGEREAQVTQNFLDAAARAWTRRELRIPGHEAGGSDAGGSGAGSASEGTSVAVPNAPPPRPRLSVCKVLADGTLELPTTAFAAFLDHEATARRCEAYLEEFARSTGRRMPASFPR